MVLLEAPAFQHTLPNKPRSRGRGNLPGMEKHRYRHWLQSCAQGGCVLLPRRSSRHFSSQPRPRQNVGLPRQQPRARSVPPCHSEARRVSRTFNFRPLFKSCYRRVSLRHKLLSLERVSSALRALPSYELFCSSTAFAPVMSKMVLWCGAKHLPGKNRRIGVAGLPHRFAVCFFDLEFSRSDSDNLTFPPL